MVHVHGFWQLGRTHFGGVSTRPLLKDAYDPCVDDEVDFYWLKLKPDCGKIALIITPDFQCNI
jgi:hypothetical protein